MASDRPQRTILPTRLRTDWVGEEDVRVVVPTEYAQRFFFDVSEEVLSKIGRHAVDEATKQLGFAVVYERQLEIQHEVDRLLFDGNWLRPIVEDEIRKTTRQFVTMLLENRNA